MSKNGILTKETIKSYYYFFPGLFLSNMSIVGALVLWPFLKLRWRIE